VARVTKVVARESIAQAKEEAALKFLVAASNPLKILTA
jgi:hypothetical protein